MNLRLFFQRFLRNDFFAALVILGIFLLTNRYIYGWDDQHLEIPLLKHLIDPALYAGDYYVESLSRNFSSYLYPILARLITVDMIPVVYLVLFCVVRYIFFYWVYRLWKWISGDQLTALCATLTLFLLGRSEEFIFRTFSHEEFALAIIFAGFYFFYRDRFLLASILLGIAANFHAIYALFPMVYLSVYVLLCVKDRGWTFLKTGLAFVGFASPFIIWHFSHALKANGGTVPVEEWVRLYLLACPQCFPLGTANPNEMITNFGVLFSRWYGYLFLIVLYGAHCLWNQDFRRDKKAHTIMGVSAFFVVVCFFCAYVKPVRFILDLNLTRFMSFAHFLLIGYTAVFLMKLAQKKELWWALMAGVLFLLIGWADTPMILSKILRYWWILAALGGFFAVAYQFRSSPFLPTMKKMFLVIPLAGMFVGYCQLHYNYVQMTQRGGGFWQLQRNWEDMQRYAKAHTPKDALFLTPYDMEMGGFRIHSDRRVIVCYRDCGIIGFDYQAVKEWQERIQEIEAFKVFTKQDIRPALMNAIGKYGATHIVFMRYYEPQGEVGFLKKMYANEVFSLYQVIR
ncbi:MAG: hypothetical protein HQL21_05480 [Candidatus Omnitrophica bacterium]|nr:hypothetical protein [Candidatus Omnitrophota bacterium]